MRFTANIVLPSMILIASPVLAQEAAAPIAVKSGDVIYAADGWRLGRINSLDKTKDGTPGAALIIFQGRMIRVPLSAVAMGTKGLTSTLQVHDIKYGVEADNFREQHADGGGWASPTISLPWSMI